MIYRERLGKCQKKGKSTDITTPAPTNIVVAQGIYLLSTK
jgi:hypothetical protein